MGNGIRGAVEGGGSSTGHDDVLQDSGAGGTDLSD